MPPVQLMRVGQTGSFQHFSQRLDGVLVKINNTFGPIIHVNHPVAALVHSGDPAGAIARCTITRLNTANRKHKGPRHVAPISTERTISDDIIGTDDFRRGRNFNAITQARTPQTIIDKHHRITQRRPQMLGKFNRCGTGAAFGAVNRDKIKPLAGLHHGFDNGNKFPWMADT